MTPYRAGYAAGSGKHAEYDMWWSLFHATSGISAWTSNNFLWNDYTLSIIGQDTSQNMKEFKSGIWDLIQKAKRQDGKIAIHYSQASVQAAEYFQRRGAPVDNWTGYVDLIEDLGLQFDFLAYEQIEQGLLANYDLLIMPESIAISTREAQQIEKFVREGGIVIADGLTGLTDDHVRSLAQPLLDNLFGIDRLAAPSKRTDYINITDAFTELLVPGTTLSCPPVQKLRLRSGAKAYAASTVGSVPALIVNSTGEGKTVYLTL